MIPPSEREPRAPSFALRVEGGQDVGATTIGALIGGAIDSMSGEDSAADGALYGAVTANVLKVVLPVVATYAVGWAVLRGLGALGDTITGKGE